MSEAENAAVVRRLVEVLNSGDVASLDEIVAATYTNRTSIPEQTFCLADAREAITLFRAAFPDLHVKAEALIAAGDKVVLRETLCGTHSGEADGIPPSGKQVKVEVVDLFRLSAGRIVESWVHFNLLRLLQQVGVKPIPPYLYPSDPVPSEAQSGALAGLAPLPPSPVRFV